MVVDDIIDGMVIHERAEWVRSHLLDTSQKYKEIYTQYKNSMVDIYSDKPKSFFRAMMEDLIRYTIFDGGKFNDVKAIKYLIAYEMEAGLTDILASTKYRITYSDEDIMDIIDADSDEEVINLARELAESHGTHPDDGRPIIVFNIDELNDDYDVIRTVF